MASRRGRLDPDRRTPAGPGSTPLQDYVTQAVSAKDRVEPASEQDHPQAPRRRHEARTSWSYVIRVKEPETGKSKPRWNGGLATEEEAKAARDEARVKERRGGYVDRSAITVRATSTSGSRARGPDQTEDAQGLPPSSTATSSRTSGICGSGRHSSPRSRSSTGPDDRRRQERRGSRRGRWRLRARGTPQGVRERWSRPAFDQPCRAGQASPAGGPRTRHVWATAQLAAFVTRIMSAGCPPSSIWPPHGRPSRGLINLRRSDIDLDANGGHASPARGPSRRGRVEGTSKSGRNHIVSLDAERSRS